MKTPRSDQSVAIYGILAITTIALIGLLVLLGMGREVPEALLTGVVLGGMTGVLGWARGGTYYDPTPEKVPGPEVPAPAPAPVPVVPTAGPAPYPAAPPGGTAYRLPPNPEDILA